MADSMEQVKAYFRQIGWAYNQVEGQSALQMLFRGQHGSWSCYIHHQGRESEFLVCYSICPVEIPEAKRTTLAEFVAWVNYGLIVGNFEMDMTDGELRYRTTIDLEGATLGQARLQQFMFANLSAMDMFLPAIMQLIHSDATPLAAIETVWRRQREADSA